MEQVILVNTNTKSYRTSKGQSMVETILVLPLLLLLIFGIIEFGRVYYTYIMLSNAAREGARYAAVRETDMENYTNSESRMLELVASYGVTIDDIAVDETAEGSDYVYAAIEYSLEAITFVGNQVTGDGNFDLHVRSEMRKE